MMNKKIVVSSVVGLVIALTGGSLVAPSIARANEEQFTTINVRNLAAGWPVGTAFGHEATLGGNVKVLLDSGSSGVGVRLKSHDIPLDEIYRLRLVAQEPRSPHEQIPRPRWPYVGVIYGSMKVDFITTDAVLATLIQTDRFQSPKQEGKVDIRVQASTAVDERRPPREVRQYAFRVTLRQVRGIRPDGTTAALGNFIVNFNDGVIFMHDPSKVPALVIPGGGCGGGGVCFPPEEIGASGPPVEAGLGFIRVISTLADFLQGDGFDGGIIIGPKDPNEEQRIIQGGIN